jgi:hypothetical protein
MRANGPKRCSKVDSYVLLLRHGIKREKVYARVMESVYMRDLKSGNPP